MSKILKNRLLLFLIISLFICVCLFLPEYFETHFYPGTVINGINVSFQTTETAAAELCDAASVYELVIYERGNTREVIKGIDIGLEPDQKHGISTIKMLQNTTPWFLSFFDRSAVHFSNALHFDMKMLKDRIAELNCMDPLLIVHPKNAALVYEEGGYKIVKEVYGNELNDSKFLECIKFAIMDGSTEIDLEKQKCYYAPEFTSDSEKISNTKTTAEKYLTATIVYTYSGGGEIVDKDEISAWICFDDNLTITFDTAKIRNFIGQLAVHYDTCGTIRDFITSTGTRIKVGGGDYGWRVDVNREANELIELIIGGKEAVKEPVYSQKGALSDLNDIGFTYVEINLTKQHLWYYQSGNLVVQGNVVSGNVNKGYKTPEGVYSLKYKIRNAVLEGENYSASVSYWMPFNNDIGIHDAPWRSHFGREIYLTRGSHGCINAPYYLAETLFNNIAVGTPVVCYY